jgi:hypothetical protein
LGASTPARAKSPQEARGQSLVSATVSYQGRSPDVAEVDTCAVALMLESPVVAED